MLAFLNGNTPFELKPLEIHQMAWAWGCGSKQNAASRKEQNPRIFNHDVVGIGKQY